MTFLLSFGYASIEFLHARVTAMSGWMPFRMSVSDPMNLVVVAFVLFVLANGLKKAKPAVAYQAVDAKRNAMTQGFGPVSQPVHEASGR